MRRLATALRAFIETLGGAPYFDPDSDERLTGEQWAAMLVLHLEAMHGCEHTDPVRAELRMVGPRGKAVDV